MAEPTPPKREEPLEDLSFGSLKEELGDVFPVRQEVEVPEVNAAGELMSLAEQERLREKREMEAKINARVLGESGANTQPMWIKGFILVVAAGVMAAALGDFAPISTYVTLLVAGGGLLWNLNGVFKDDEPRDKALALAAALLSGAIGFYAWGQLG